MLPDDVLGLIREYSRPLLRFSGEFRKVLMELGMKDWPEVRKKLCTPDAEQVIRVLLAYKDAHLETQYRAKLIRTRPRYPRLISSSQVESIHCKKQHDKLYRELQVLLIGEQNVLDLEREF